MSEIDHDVPLPDCAPRGGRVSAYSFKELGIGDSIVVTGGPNTSYWSLRTGFKFVTRQIKNPDGSKHTRVWRVS